MIALTPGQAFVVVLVLAALGVVILWGLWTAENDRQRRLDERERAGRLRRELARHDTDDPPRWIG